MIVLDTSGLLALLDAGEAAHRAALAAVASDSGPLVTIDLVLAETDYLVHRRLGGHAERAFVAQLVEGAFLREPVSDDDLRRADEIARGYADQDLGLTDTCVMAVTERLGTRRLLTLDTRHFSIFRDRRGAALELLPGGFKPPPPVRSRKS